MVNASALKESAVAARQGNYITLLTRMTVVSMGSSSSKTLPYIKQFYLPLGLPTVSSHSTLSHNTTLSRVVLGHLQHDYGPEYNPSEMVHSSFSVIDDFHAFNRIVQRDPQPCASDKKKEERAIRIFDTATNLMKVNATGCTSLSNVRISFSTKLCSQLKWKSQMSCRTNVTQQRRKGRI